MKASTFAGICAAGVVTGVAVYAITESGIVEKTEDAVADGAKKAGKKVKGIFTKKKAEEVVEDEEVVELDDAQ